MKLGADICIVCRALNTNIFKPYCVVVPIKKFSMGWVGIGMVGDFLLDNVMSSKTLSCGFVVGHWTILN